MFRDSCAPCVRREGVVDVACVDHHAFQQEMSLHIVVSQRCGERLRGVEGHLCSVGRHCGYGAMDSQRVRERGP